MLQIDTDYMYNKDEENLQNKTDKGSKGVVEPPVKAEALQFFEEGVVLKGDRVGRDVLLHPVLPRFVRVPLHSSFQIRRYKCKIWIILSLRFKNATLPGSYSSWSSFQW